MKRLIAFIISLTLIGTALTSCGALGIGSGNGSNKGKSETRNYGVYKLITTYEGEVLGGTVEMGEFPQTKKADGVTLSEEPLEDGYYLGSDGERYAKLKATPNENLYDQYKYGEEYFFKVEPILWRVASIDGGIYFLVCQSVLCARRFDDNSLNYANSELRAWLNGEFFDTAFSDEQFFTVLSTELDNSAESLKKEGIKEDYLQWIDSNPYYCENTTDKVFIRSYKELSYSGGSNVTDYARATGYYGENTGYSGARYDSWTRSPYWSNTIEVIVQTTGYSYGNILSCKPNNTKLGVVPCIKIPETK